MEERDDITIRIDRYLRGDMDTPEREAFEAECRTDADLARSLALQAQAEIALRAQAHDIRTTELNAQFDALAPESAPIRPLPSMWPAIAVAAAVVLLFLLFFLFPTSHQPLDSHQLYADNLKEKPALSLLRTADASIPSPWQAAADSYNGGDYTKAIEVLQQMLADSVGESRPKLYYYLGLSYLWLQDSLDAAEVDPEVNYRRLGRQALAQLDTRSSFGEKASWYVALSYLAEANIPEARTALVAITEQQIHYRTQEAQKLLELLE